MIIDTETVCVTAPANAAAAANIFDHEQKQPHSNQTEISERNIASVAHGKVVRWRRGEGRGEEGTCICSRTNKNNFLRNGKEMKRSSSKVENNHFERWKG